MKYEEMKAELAKDIFVVIDAIANDATGFSET